MRPVPIADELIPEGCKRLVIAAPDGDLLNDEIRPIEAVVGLTEDRGPLFAMLLQLEEGDLERLQACGGLWLSMYTNQLPPFAVEIADGQG